MFVVADQATQPEVVRDGSSEDRARHQLPPRDRIVFVVCKATGQAGLGAAITKIRYKSGRCVTTGGEVFRQRGMGRVERDGIIGRKLVMPATREHAGI